MIYIQPTRIFNLNSLPHYPVSQGDDYMVPFSPARPSAASPKDSPQTPPNSGTPGDNVMVSAKEDTPVVAVDGGVEDASPKEDTAAPAQTAALTPDVSPTGAAGGGGGGGGVLLDGVPSTKEFMFSDDDESEDDELGGRGRGTTRPEESNQHDGDTKINNGGGGSVDGGEVEKEETRSDNTASAEESDTAATAKGAGSGGSREEEKRKRDGRRGRRRRSKSSSNSNNDKSDYHSRSGSSGSDDDDCEKSKPVDERTRHRSSRREALLLNPLSVPKGVQFDDGGVGADYSGDNSSDGGNLTPPPGRGKRGVMDSACATPAPDAWAAPDFGFSSDDDLDIKFSSSEPSPGRSVERSLSSSPTAGNGRS